MKGERERERERERDLSIITVCHTLGVITPQLSWLQLVSSPLAIVHLSATI